MPSVTPRTISTCERGAEREIRTPRPWDSGFRIHAIPGYAISARSDASHAGHISVVQGGMIMRIRLLGLEGSHEVDIPAGSTVGDALEAAGIPPSTVLVLDGTTMIPVSASLSEDITLELIVVSSGG